MYNVLICDDDEDIVKAIAFYLKAEGYNIFQAYNGAEAVETIRNNEIHLVVLDVMMPIMDGMEALRRIREFSEIPVIFLTAKSEDTDKVLGLNCGADDYVTKPFNPVELQARVKSQLRRYMLFESGKKSEEIIQIGGLAINIRTQEVSVDGDIISMTRIEYSILQFLMKNRGRSFSPDEIYEQVWQQKSFGNISNVAVHIRHIREKIEIDPANPRYLKALWGKGYKIDDKEQL